MTTYAKNTKVSPEKSRIEIERDLSRYGATSFNYGWDDDGDQTRTGIAFKYNDRTIRFLLTLPSKQDREIHFTETGKLRRPSAVEAAYNQAIRQKWRALALVIKAKLEAVESGIVSFEDEFLAHMTLPDGSRVGDRVQQWVEESYELGHVPALALPLPHSS